MIKFRSFILLSLLVIVRFDYNVGIILYDTEDNVIDGSEYYDCIYHVDDGQVLPYCRRPEQPIKLRRILKKNDTCYNGGEMKSFVKLLEQGITPRQMLDWNSNVELVDDYASIFYKNHMSDEENKFICICKKQGTFGKHCEYQLAGEFETFEQAIQMQFDEKKKDRWSTQFFGKILCYTTLNCLSGHLCLDWRDICDGIQTCMDGIDEENCDKLEFNECDQNEFRCDNGMCIPEEYWLDGDFDCMDWTDEYPESFYGNECPYSPNRIECDEHLCVRHKWSCGDGQCINHQDRFVYEGIMVERLGCFNERHLNYMCELNPSRSLWTLDSGLCWPSKGYDDPKLSMSNHQLSNDEKCTYLIRCALSDGFEKDCPCNHRNCSNIMRKVCKKRFYPYPIKPLIYPYLTTIYGREREWTDSKPDYFELKGSIKCRGYHLTKTGSLVLLVDNDIFRGPEYSNYFFCLEDDNSIINKRSPMQYHEFCWSDSLTFNGRPYAFYDLCNESHQCISQYRIMDGVLDCALIEDETRTPMKDLCSNSRKNRLKCDLNDTSCLSQQVLGNNRRDCFSNNDEYYDYNDSPISRTKCLKRNDEGCQVLKTYIRNTNLAVDSSSIIQANWKSISKMPFHRYCDGTWDLSKHIDELPQFCSHWICNQDQYQCQTGQCIDLNWICDGEWDCSDASDEEAFVLIKIWSSHNAPFISSNRNKLSKKCRERFSLLPFTRICDTSIEFPCYLANVSNPLDIKTNRPCINLTQIGDGIENCYNAYDEKNTFVTDSEKMWGYYFPCSNELKVTDYNYISICGVRKDFDPQCTQFVCAAHQKRSTNESCSNINDAICVDNGRCVPDGRCDGEQDCRHGDDEYWCLPKQVKATLTK